MHAFHINLPPKRANSFVSENASKSPARVPDGHKYLQNTGVSLTNTGRIITAKTRTKYLIKRRYLSALKLLIFLKKAY